MDTIRTLSDLRAALPPGTRLSVENHYVTRPDHPCYGTRERLVLRSTSTGLWLSHPDHAEGSRVDWPKRSQVVPNGDGSVTFLGGGCNQSEGEPFLTLRVLREERHETMALFQPAPNVIPGQQGFAV